MQTKSQTPSAQVGVALDGGEQTVAQSPQCTVLFIRSTQEPSQFSVPPPQLVPHSPPAHTSAPLQTLAQSPQCAASETRSTHAPSQFV
jgi:hypothetical protein